MATEAAMATASTLPIGSRPDQNLAQEKMRGTLMIKRPFEAGPQQRRREGGRELSEG